MFQRGGKISKMRAERPVFRNGHWRYSDGRFAKAPKHASANPQVREATAMGTGMCVAIAVAAAAFIPHLPAIGWSTDPEPRAEMVVETDLTKRAWLAAETTEALALTSGNLARLANTAPVSANAKPPVRRVALKVSRHAARQRRCLIQLAYHEARSESDLSIIKRVWTAVYRARRPDFTARTICQAVFQHGAFSAFLKGIPPMRNRRALARMTRIVDSQMPAILPAHFGGSRCIVWEAGGVRCHLTVAGTIPQQPVMTHHAEADCYYLGRKGYDYVRRGNRCVPRWATRMVEVASTECTMIRNRPCTTVFWRVDRRS